MSAFLSAEINSYLQQFSQKFLYDSIMHKRLHSGALYTFLTFSLISLLVLLREMLPGKMNDSFYPIIGLGLSLAVLAMSLPLLRITKQSLNVRYMIGGIFTVIVGVKFSASASYLLAPMLCTAGVLLQYFGYALSLKKLNEGSRYR